MINWLINWLIKSVLYLMYELGLLTAQLWKIHLPKHHAALNLTAIRTWTFEAVATDSEHLVEMTLKARNNMHALSCASEQQAQKNFTKPIIAKTVLSRAQKCNGAGWGGGGSNVFLCWNSGCSQIDTEICVCNHFPEDEPNPNNQRGVNLLHWIKPCMYEECPTPIRKRRKMTA